MLSIRREASRGYIIYRLRYCRTTTFLPADDCYGAQEIRCGHALAENYNPQRSKM